LVALVVGVASLAVVAAVMPIHTVPAAMTELGPAGPVVGIAVGAALLVALVPRTPISVACGLIFGATLGCVCAIAAMLLGAAVTFGVGRRLGREFLARRVGAGDGRLARAWRRLERWIARESTLAVAAVRSFPIAPYGLVGYAYGASNVRMRDYALGTFMAGTPSAIAYALLGASIEGTGRASMLTYAPLACGILLIGAATLRTVRRRRSTVD
jgi:uncharacterized membrane protein YdjX (TVP38/TMEM64 family)